MDTLKFVIPGKPEYMTMVRLATGALAAKAGFTLDDAEDVKMAVAEACKNVSCHGNEGYSDKYEIEYNVGEGSMEITVIDACDQHSLQKMSKQCQHCPQEGDIGFIMLRSLMTCVELGHDDQGHKFITMVKKEQR